MDLPVLGVDFDKLLTRVFDGFVIVVAFDIVDGLVLERRVERVVDVASRDRRRERAVFPAVHEPLLALAENLDDKTAGIDLGTGNYLAIASGGGDAELCLGSVLKQHKPTSSVMSTTERARAVRHAVCPVSENPPAPADPCHMHRQQDWSYCYR